MSVASLRKIYNTYASFYDFLFGAIFSQGRSLCVDIINKAAKPQAHILEIGIGTGLSLPLYRADLCIAGIDISEKMLEKAEEQVRTHHLEERVTLNVMDAAYLEFPNDHFDFIVAMYVASVVPDIDAFLQEVIRVAKPGAEIIFVNHFASEQPVMHFFEKKFACVNNLVGFNSNFSINSILECTHLTLLKSYNTNLFGYWKVVHCQIVKEDGDSV